jgi:hypothetical protein
VRDPAGAGGEVGGERVEVHVVEGEPDSVVSEVGEEGERVVQPEVGKAVGAVAEAEGPAGVEGKGPRIHVTLTFFANRAPSGARAAMRRAVAVPLDRAVRVAWRGIVARMPAPTARWVSGGEGLSVAWK